MKKGQKMSAESSAKKSLEMKKICSDPKYKSKQSEASKKAWSDYERSAAIRKSNSTPESKIRRSKFMTGRIKSDSEIEPHKSHLNQKIICLDTGVIYKNQAEVARIFMVVHSTIARSINEKKPCMAGSFARLVEYMEEQNAKRVL